MELPRIGPYELLVRLAAGGAANVFLVRDLEAEPPGRLLALKVLLPSLAQNEDFLKMFFTEARIASKLHHPNVVAIAGFGQVDGVHCLAMEYVFGASLSQVLRASARAKKPLSVGVLLSVTAAVCDALHYAHELEGDDGQPMSLVHRDVTPQNILIGFNGIPKLTDFGIAKATNRGWETQAGIVKGKFSYMSPEQALGKKVDRRSDIFGTGIVLWEALTGQDLFRGSTPMEVLTAIRELKIQAPSKVVEGLTSVVDDIVMKSLRRSARQRFPTALAMGEEIRSLIRKAGVTIDAQAISREFAVIYGDTIEKRALALRAAMAGQIDTAELAKVMGAHELDARHLPRTDPNVQNRDPLGLGRRRVPPPRQDSRMEVSDEDVESLDEESSVVEGFREASGWEDSTAMHVPNDELLGLLSEADATAGQVPASFKERFHEGDPGFEEEMTVGHVASPQPRLVRDWAPPSGTDGAGSPSMTVRPPSSFLNLERPVPRAPSLDMEVEATPPPQVEPILPGLDTDSGSDGQEDFVTRPGKQTEALEGAAVPPIVPSPVYGPNGRDDGLGDPTSVISSELDNDSSAREPDPVFRDETEDRSPPDPAVIGAVQVPIGALIFGGLILMAAGIGIGFVLFGLQ